MTAHTFTQDNLAAYALGELPPEQSQALRRHVEVCDACRRDLAAMQEVLAISTSLAETSAPVMSRTAREN